MPMDYFIWLVRNQERLVLVDTGFNAEVAARRKRTLVREPRDGLALLGVKAEDVREIIITHMHNDHVGTFFDFPNATFHIQEEEMSFVTGRHMRNQFFRRSFEIEHVVGMVRMVFKDRVVFHQGDDDIAPGVSVHHIGGHTPGLQSVRVHTQRGWVVLASDASHYYEHMEKRRCFPAVFHAGQVLDGYDKLFRLAETPKHVVPGHDPLVMKRYPPPSPELEGVAVRLDVDPVE
jgi:glyoxylase-like metal-dependent hydrolase (beta-lactamase superfamily II)